VPIPIRFVRSAHASRGRAPASFSRSDVHAVQEALLSQGLSPYCDQCGPGYWGSCSESACAAFQQRAGLPVNGQIDDVTLDALGVELP
jgi:murein L,D-transpeptidase YcbB/YkuD